MSTMSVWPYDEGTQENARGSPDLEERLHGRGPLNAQRTAHDCVPDAEEHVAYPTLAEALYLAVMGDGV